MVEYTFKLSKTIFLLALPYLLATVFTQFIDRSTRVLLMLFKFSTSLLPATRGRHYNIIVIIKSTLFN